MGTPDLSREARNPARRRRSILAVAAVAVTAAIWLLLPASSGAVAGAAFTTDNPAVTAACLNGGVHTTPGVNCNIYTAKGDVWINGGPSAGQNHLTDGTYFFAVLVPGGQPDPNDDGAKNLSDTNPLGGLADPNLCGGGGNTLTGCGDAYTNRTFTVSGGHISAYGGTHAKDSVNGGALGMLINLMPYDTTSNNGGVYILAICEMPSSPTTGEGAPGVVNASSCKYDAFKVKESEPPPPPGKVQSCFSGIKYRDDDKSGNFTGGETLLPNWVIDISDGTNDYTATTDESGFWSWCEPEHDSADGTTTYTFTEELQTGWKQTGNTVDDGIYSSNVVSESLSSFVYSVEVPNDESAAADSLDFGNIPQGNVWGAKYYDTNQNGQWDSGEPLISGWKILRNATPFYTGSSFVDDNSFAANFSATLDPGSYTFAEVLSGNGWMQTGNTVNQTFTTGGATASLATKIYTVTIPNDQPSSVSKVYFGNVCTRTPGGLTLGFWSNKNGQALETADDFTALNALNLRNANGTNRDFTDTLAKNKSALSSWLLSATATNMAYMLSAQLAATVLDVRHGVTNGTILVDGTNTVNDVIAAANSLLANPIAGGTFNGQNGSVTVASSALRTEQERLKNILDKINNGGSFIQPSPDTCLPLSFR